MNLIFIDQLMNIIRIPLQQSLTELKKLFGLVILQVVPKDICVLQASFPLYHGVQRIINKFHLRSWQMLHHYQNINLLIQSLS